MLYDIKIRIWHYAQTYYSFVKCAHTYTFTGNPPIDNGAVLKWKRGNFAPRGDKWQQHWEIFSVVTAQGVLQGCFSTSYNIQDSPKINNPAPNVNSKETEKPCIRVMASILLSTFLCYIVLQHNFFQIQRSYY